MNNGYILFYDSGIGGLTTLKETIRLLPNERFLYFADDSNCPYGNKSSDEINKLVIKNLNSLLKRYNIKLIVFACNTVTTCAVGELRAKYKFDIVGTEPAILPAMQESQTKQILVIATHATFKQEKFKRLKEKVGGKVICFGQTHLAGDIETAMLSKKLINLSSIYTIRDIFKQNKNLSGLVLGCTHYCFYKCLFEKIVKTKVYDGNLGVAKRAKVLLEEKNNLADKNFKGAVKILLSSKHTEKTNRYYKILDNIIKNQDKFVL